MKGCKNFYGQVLIYINCSKISKPVHINRRIRKRQEIMQKVVWKRKQLELISISLMVMVCAYLVSHKPKKETMEYEEDFAENLELVKKETDSAEVIQTSITPGQYPIMGISDISVSQMVSYFNENCSEYPAEILGEGGAANIEEFCRIYYEEAEKEGVRAEVAFAQTMKETGWLKYGGDAEIEQYNFAGIGTTGGGTPGNSFADVRTGVRAQIQHLKAYATEETLNEACVDERYKYVNKGSAPYVEWLGQQENPAGCGWATGKNYGYDIVEMISDMKKI